MKMKELPNLERPYEKLETFGAEKLSMAELLAIIIKTGTKNRSAVDIAHEVLKKDTEENGICFLNSITLEELKKIEGIGRVKAIELKATIEIANRLMLPGTMIRRKISSPEEVYRLMSAEYKHRETEVLKTVLLDGKNRLIKVVEVSVGTANYSMVELKDVFKEPIKVGATGFILVHNHPSGDSKPSLHDIAITKKIKDAAETFGINLIDHVIIGNGEFSSLKRLKKF